MSPLRTYPTLAAARESSLALGARGWAYEIDRAGDEWLLLVEEPHVEAARAELALFEQEQQSLPPPPPERVFQPYSPWSLVWVGLVLVGIFLCQQRPDLRLSEAGEADAQAIILHGEWWRCFTALTLHGDLSHIAANLMTGALFAGFLAPQLGGSLSWLAIVLAGALGNWLNSWGYRGASHHSLGASTAVFGALGLLTAGEVIFRWRASELGRWRLLAPLGGGLALLAFLGVGEPHEQVDFTAHFWGLGAGLALAGPMGLLHRRLGRWQGLAGLLAAALLGGAWWLALR